MDDAKNVVDQVIAIGQGGIFKRRDPALIGKLIQLNKFYKELGGIAGYHKKVLELLEKKGEDKKAKFHSPHFIDITGDVTEYVAWGLEAMEEMAEIYPLGGAADRLHLIDEKTGEQLPAAKLRFAGKMLLEGLIDDLKARELLYFQRTGKTVVTPLAIMTSEENNNHAHVLEIFEEKNWFGRPRESVRFFTQPLVPAVNEKGQWCLNKDGSLMMKPGGHGAIWKLAKDEGIFTWLKSLGKKKALVRQINNPIAGLDSGLLAFIGIGWKKKMLFGFASAPRLLKAAEGVNILVEKEGRLALSNIEYCDFAKFGIEDLPLKEGEPYSRFSSNTNILFLDLDAVQKAVEVMPFPGLLVNLKKTDKGLVARLESTMQNIADVFTEEKTADLKTFITYNHRHKTISPAKRAYVTGGTVQETPEKSFYDLLFAHRELLLSCGFKLPNLRALEEYLEKGPEFCFLYHPTLGPLYSTLREKLKKGELGLGSELLLEPASLSAKNVRVFGSLRILGTGTCSLENVTVENKGIDWSQSAPFWRMNLKRTESATIVLKGNSEFCARNLYLKGNHTFIVEEGKRLIL